MSEEEILYEFLQEACGIGDGKPVPNPRIYYRELCDWVDSLWHDSCKFFCWGCHKSGAIEHHHMISTQEMKKIGKPWLIIDPTNLIPLCNECHHNRWHDGGIEKKLELKCLNIIMDYFKDNHHELYMKLYFKIEEYNEKHNKTINGQRGFIANRTR